MPSKSRRRPSLVRPARDRYAHAMGAARGRPKRRTTKPRVVAVRLEPADYAALMRLAGTLGLSTMAAYLRYLAIQQLVMHGIKPAAVP